MSLQKDPKVHVTIMNNRIVIINRTEPKKKYYVSLSTTDISNILGLDYTLQEFREFIKHGIFIFENFSRMGLRITTPLIIKNIIVKATPL